MRKQVRYGDEGTIVTVREQAVAALFVVAVAALLIGDDDNLNDAAPERVAQTFGSVQADASGAPVVESGSGRRLEGGAP